MSITAYSGLPGHGKTYGVVKNVIIPALKDKRIVYSNVPMNDDACIKRFGITTVFFDVKDIIDNPNWFDEVFEPGAILVIDEVYKVWQNGLNVKSANQNHVSFLAEHRHLVGDNGKSTEIILITQDLAQIASFVRLLVETTFRVTKLSHLGMSKSFRVDVYPGAVSGSSPPASKRSREIPGKFDKKIYELYISHTKSDVGAGDEGRTDSRFNILGGLSIKIGIAVIVVFAFFVFYGSSKVKQAFGRGDVETAESSETAGTRRVVSSSGAQPVEQVESKPEVFKLMTHFSDSFISFNNGVYPDIDYLINLKKGDFYSTVTLADISGFGYEFTPINPCLIRYQGQKTTGVITCKVDIKKSIIQKTFSGVTGS